MEESRRIKRRLIKGSGRKRREYYERKFGIGRKSKRTKKEQLAKNG